jgi:hypothetical protein
MKQEKHDKHDSTDYYRLASGYYQFEDLPDNYLEIEDDEFYKLLEANAWQPFEGYMGKDIASFIESLAVEMENIARRERKRIQEPLNEIE